MANLFDLMTPEDKRKSLDAYEKRMNGDTSYRSQKISAISFLLAEFGYYYGWEAIAAAKRGYIEGYDEIHQKRIKIPLTMEEINEYVEGARKVWYGKVIDNARASQIGTATAFNDNDKHAFDKAIKPYLERTR